MTPRNRTELVELMARETRPEFFNLNSCQPGACNKCDAGRKAAIGDMHAALTALEQAGCAVVPREATEEMISGMEEMHMPMGEMTAAWDGAMFANPYVKEG